MKKAGLLRASPRSGPKRVTRARAVPCSHRLRQPQRGIQIFVRVVTEATQNRVRMVRQGWSTKQWPVGAIGRGRRLRPFIKASPLPQIIITDLADKVGRHVASTCRQWNYNTLGLARID